MILRKYKDIKPGESFKYSGIEFRKSKNSVGFSTTRVLPSIEFFSDDTFVIPIFTENQQETINNKENICY